MSLTAPARPDDALGWPSSGIALAFWGARHHPDLGARAAIATALARWAKIDPEALLGDAVLPGFVPPLPASLPFVVTPSDQHDIAALAALVFSPRVGGSRLRVASRDAIVGQFGVAMTARGRSYPARQNLEVAPRRAANAVAYLNPVGLSSALSVLANPTHSDCEAHSTVSAKGLIISVMAGRWASERSDLAFRLTKTSTLVQPDGKVLPFESLGLWVSVQKEAVQVQPKTSEGTIRLTALMARGARMVLSPGVGDDGASMRVVIRLAPAGPGTTRLGAVATDAAPELDDWIRLRWPQEPALPLQLCLILAQHLRMHESWAVAELIDKQLADAP